MTGLCFSGRLMCREFDFHQSTQYLNGVSCLQVLLRDATTLLLHFSLILPVQIDRVFFTTIVRQVEQDYFPLLHQAT